MLCVAWWNRASLSPFVYLSVCLSVHLSLAISVVLFIRAARYITATSRVVSSADSHSLYASAVAGVIHCITGLEAVVIDTVYTYCGPTSISTSCPVWSASALLANHLFSRGRCISDGGDEKEESGGCSFIEH